MYSLGHNGFRPRLQKNAPTSARLQRWACPFFRDFWGLTPFQIVERWPFRGKVAISWKGGHFVEKWLIILLRPRVFHAVVHYRLIQPPLWHQPVLSVVKYNIVQFVQVNFGVREPRASHIRICFDTSTRKLFVRLQIECNISVYRGKVNSVL